MSDFTSANLILLKDKDIAGSFLDTNTYLIEQNDKWVYRVAKGDGANWTYKMNEKVFSQQVLALSELTPVFSFIGNGGEGFGFVILSGKEVISSFYIDIEFDMNLPMNLAIELYGTRKGFNLWMEDSSGFDVMANERRNDELLKVFSNIHTENFKLFGCTDSDINDLSALLTPAGFDNPEVSMEDRFKEILGIQDLTFISYEYIEANEEKYTIIAMM